MIFTHWRANEHSSLVYASIVKQLTVVIVCPSQVDAFAPSLPANGHIYVGQGCQSASTQTAKDVLWFAPGTCPLTCHSRQTVSALPSCTGCCAWFAMEAAELQVQPALDSRHLTHVLLLGCRACWTPFDDPSGGDIVSYTLQAFEALVDETQLTAGQNVSDLVSTMLLTEFMLQGLKLQV